MDVPVEAQPYSRNRHVGYPFLFLIIGFIMLSVAPDAMSQSRTSTEAVKIRAIAGLQYDKVRFVVEPGTTVKVTLENASEMMHNIIFSLPGTREKVVEEAEALGGQGMAKDFIPKTSSVLASIPLLDPGESATITFLVPDKEGAYPYVCTYPAHGVVMYGVMYVTSNPEILPPLEEDPHVPEMIRKKRWAASGSFHPYPMEMPQVNRLFMPNASPASIAVGMKGNQSYCWDAGVCHLRYAWRGGYINPTDQWDAKATEFAEIEGDIFYRNHIGFPFRFVNPDSVDTPEFLGYELVDGYPRFMYKTGDIHIHEMILPAKERPGLEIRYELRNVDQTVWYAATDNTGVRVEASRGEWEGNMLRLSPEQAKDFTITIIPD